MIRIKWTVKTENRRVLTRMRTLKTKKRTLKPWKYQMSLWKTLRARKATLYITNDGRRWAQGAERWEWERRYSAREEERYKQKTLSLGKRCLRTQKWTLRIRKCVSRILFLRNHKTQCCEQQDSSIGTFLPLRHIYRRPEPVPLLHWSWCSRRQVSIVTTTAGLHRQRRDRIVQKRRSLTAML